MSFPSEISLEGAEPKQAEIVRSGSASGEIQTVAIQGERGSNSHMAALQMLDGVEVVPCIASGDVFRALVEGSVDAAVLPIENSLHGSVAEHYDLLLANNVHITGESLLRVRHHLIAAPGVALGNVQRVLSHPVALSQCRNYLSSLRSVEIVPFYDTAGSVKHVVGENLRNAAGVAPELAAAEYGGEVLVRGIEDHAENYTRFYLLRPGSASSPAKTAANKLTVAFAIQHRPGTLVSALQLLAESGVDLTRIESRPVPGRPWEYVFYVDFRFDHRQMADAAIQSLNCACTMVKELGRYTAA